MHILRNNAMRCVKVSLRKRELPSGKITLYLDYYPPIRDVSTNKCHRHEYLGIYLLKSPKTRAEKAVNTEKLLQAEAIRAERELSILRGKLDFLDRSKLKMDFLAYFRNQLDSHDQKWTKVYDHFYNYVDIFLEQDSLPILKGHFQGIPRQDIGPHSEAFSQLLTKRRYWERISMTILTA